MNNTVMVMMMKPLREPCGITSTARVRGAGKVLRRGGLKMIDLEPSDIVVLDYRLPLHGWMKSCARSKKAVPRSKSLC
jgi:hypothetical protein